MSFLPILLTLTGVFSLIQNRKVLCSPKKLFAHLRQGGKAEKRQTRKNLLLALSGTLGVGNITGVATALLLGGEGSIFWMLISTLFSIPLKYAEATLSARDGTGGGMSGVLSKVFGKKSGKILSRVYAYAFLFLSLVLGGAVQGNAIIENATTHLSFRKEILATALVVFLAIFAFGKITRIVHILSFTLPLATLVYMAMCFAVLFTHRALLPTLVGRILHSAFSGFQPTVAGLLGTLTSNTVKEGFFAGLLSNEAGAGTSALAHEEKSDPSKSGVVGVLEVLFDTTFLCFLSGLTFLVANAHLCARDAGEVLWRAFFPLFGEAYIIPLLFSIIFLATSSSLCYLVYARRTLAFLHLEKYTVPFTLLFLFATAIGGLFRSTPLVILSHEALTLLSLLTSLAIFGAWWKKKAKKRYLPLTKEENTV